MQRVLADRQLLTGDVLKMQILFLMRYATRVITTNHHVNIIHCHCDWGKFNQVAGLSLQALDLQEDCMHALEDLRSRFAASQRTVGHLSRDLIAAQLKQQSSLGHVLSAPAALEAQEALLSRHQTYAHRIRHEMQMSMQKSKFIVGLSIS